MKVGRISLRKIVAQLSLVWISLSTIFFGSGSLIYYFFAGIALLAGIIYVALDVKGKALKFSIALVFAMLALSSVNMLRQLYAVDSSVASEFLRLAAIVTVLIALTAGAKLNDENFRSLMGMTAIVHVPALLYEVIIVGDQVEGTGRVYSDTLATASISEIALGVFFAAVLSRNWFVIIFSLAVSAALIYLTQMRTAGIALALALVVSIIMGPYMNLSGGKRYIWLFGAFGASAIVIVSFYTSFALRLAGALMINDPYRGVQTGFSGRFDNWIDGIGIFAENWVTGVGLQNDVMNYTHNGYILTLGQFGVFLGGSLIFALFYALWLALRQRQTGLIVVIIALVAFYIGQPRNINFQLFPLVGLFAISRAFAWKNHIEIGGGKDSL